MVIFWSGPLLFVYSLIIFVGITYTVVSFNGYGLDRRHLQLLQQVERSMQENEMEQQAADSGHDGSREMSENDRQHIDAIVERWLAKGGHLHSGLTIQTAADEMHLKRYQLYMWVKTTPQGIFARWLTHLRIEEAKQQLLEHPEWSNDTIAERCGFSTRNYFQTIFKRYTGITPQEFQSRK